VKGNYRQQRGKMDKNWVLPSGLKTGQGSKKQKIAYTRYGCKKAGGKGEEGAGRIQGVRTTKRERPIRPINKKKIQ